METSKFSEEVAQENLDVLIAYYKIRPERLPADQKAAVESSLEHLKWGIMDGNLEIEVTPDSIIVRQNLDKPIAGAPNPLVYKEIDAASKIAMKEDSNPYGKAYSLLGALCGEGLGAMLKLKGSDMSLAESLGCVFLQV